MQIEYARAADLKLNRLSYLPFMFAKLGMNECALLSSQMMHGWNTWNRVLLKKY